MLRLVPRDPESSVPYARPALDDNALLAAIRGGDPMVASALCDRLWPQVDRTIRRLIGSRDVDHDDLAQLSMIELVGTISRYRGDCSLDTWAQAVTANVVFKHLRRRRVERRIFADILVDDEMAAAPAHVERRSAGRQVLARIAKHLDGMNERRAWAFVLHDVLGYDLREVAQMTNASVAATQSLLVRGRRELHERIGHDPSLVDLFESGELAVANPGPRLPRPSRQAPRGEQGEGDR
jgi:RNA polymerase sigma factor (sigma-70 family)